MWSAIEVPLAFLAVGNMYSLDTFFLILSVWYFLCGRSSLKSQLGSLVPADYSFSILTFQFCVSVYSNLFMTGALLKSQPQFLFIFSPWCLSTSSL